MDLINQVEQLGGAGKDETEDLMQEAELKDFLNFHKTQNAAVPTPPTPPEGGAVDTPVLKPPKEGAVGTRGATKAGPSQSDRQLMVIDEGEEDTRSSVRDEYEAEAPPRRYARDVPGTEGTQGGANVKAPSPVKKFEEVHELMTKICALLALKLSFGCGVGCCNDDDAKKTAPEDDGIVEEVYDDRYGHGIQERYNDDFSQGYPPEGPMPSPRGYHRRNSGPQTPSGYHEGPYPHDYQHGGPHDNWNNDPYNHRRDVYPNECRDDVGYGGPNDYSSHPADPNEYEYRQDQSYGHEQNDYQRDYAYENPNGYSQSAPQGQGQNMEYNGGYSQGQPNDYAMPHQPYVQPSSDYGHHAPAGPMY
uniref:Uncharacterized protein n=1 Tax=Ditylum brightwellii TaxID=49249 RepID=A0A7S2EJ23_9STRA